MSVKQNSSGGDEPGEVFRQFAWHLAGSLAPTRAGGAVATASAKPRPGKGGAKR